MKRKMVWLVVSCLMVAALLLASCAPAAPEEKDEVTPAPKVEEKAKEEKVVEEVVTPAKSEPEYGGTIKIVTYLTTYEPQYWDPAQVFWLTSHYNSLFQENLLIGDLWRGPRGTNEYGFSAMQFTPYQFVIGQLAESWETPDPTHIVFNIRPGVYWQDKPGVMTSRELTAEDVVFTWNRQLEAPKMSTRTREWIKSVTAPDKYTAVFELSEYHGDWKSAIGYATTGKIYPPELVKAGIADWKNATGTGPFMLVDYVSGANLIYERNPNYWKKYKLDGKEYDLPFVDRLMMPVIPDASTVLAALRTGKTDITETIGWSYVESLDDTNPELLKFQLLSSSVVLVGMRVDTPPFDDIRVRRALSMAVDQPTYLISTYGGYGEILNFPLEKSAGEVVYTPLDKLPEAVREMYEYHPEKAKQLLAEAGYPDGFKAELVATSEDLASILAAWFEVIGVELDIKTYEYGTWTSIMYSKTHKHMLTVSKGIGGTFGLMRSMGSDPPGGYNPANYADPEFIALLEAALTEMDEAESNRMLKEANLKWISDAPYIVMPTAGSFRYAAPWVMNYYGESNAGSYTPGPVYAEIWLDRKMREEMTGRR